MTNELLVKLGMGAGMAWLALGALYLTVRRTPHTVPTTRERQLRWVLFLSVSFLAVPFAPRPALWAASLHPPQTVTLTAKPRHASPPASRPLPWQQGLGAAWLSLMALGTLRLLRQVVSGIRQSRAQLEVPRTLRERVETLCRRMGLETPRIVVRGDAAMSFVARPLTPTLVVPAWVLNTLDPDALDQVLAHELTHLSRNDLVWGLVHAMVRVPFTGHPVAAWLEGELVHAREAAVDGRVEPTHQASYAKLLLMFAERRTARAAHIGMGSGALTRRVEQLFSRPQRRAATWPAWLVSAVLVSAALWFSPPAQAQTAAVDNQQIFLPLGSTLTLDHEDELRTVSVADPTVADIKVLNHPLCVLVMGRGVGRTSLLFYNRDGSRRSYTVTVGTHLAGD